MWAALESARSAIADAGLVASLAVLLEKKSRRAELALYTLPRAVDSFLLTMLHRRWVPSLRFGEQPFPMFVFPRVALPLSAMGDKVMQLCIPLLRLFNLHPA